MGSKKKSIPLQGYDAIAERYEQVYGNNPSEIRAVNWLIKHLPSGSRVLDLGCGTGVPAAKLLVDHGFSVTGIDNSTVMIKLARQRVPQGVFLEMNFKRLKLQGEFEAVIAFFSLLHVQRDIFTRTLKKIASYLVPPGYFLVSMVEGDVNAKGKILGQSMYFNAYPRSVLQGLLEQAGFEIIKFEENVFIPRVKKAEPETQLFYYTRKSGMNA